MNTGTMKIEVSGATYEFRNPPTHQFFDVMAEWQSANEFKEATKRLTSKFQKEAASATDPDAAVKWEEKSIEMTRKSNAAMSKAIGCASKLLGECHMVNGEEKKVDFSRLPFPDMSKIVEKFVKAQNLTEEEQGN